MTSVLATAPSIKRLDDDVGVGQRRQQTGLDVIVSVLATAPSPFGVLIYMASVLGNGRQQTGFLTIMSR